MLIENTMMMIVIILIEKMMVMRFLVSDRDIKGNNAFI